MDKFPRTDPPRYQRDGHFLTVENHFTGEKLLLEVIRAYLTACREDKP